MYQAPKERISPETCEAELSKRRVQTRRTRIPIHSQDCRIIRVIEDCGVTIAWRESWERSTQLEHLSIRDFIRRLEVDVAC